MEPTTTDDGSRNGPYGPREAADDTRQAQQSVSNDAPTDVNMNAIIAREQGSTLTLMGKNFEANAMRFNGLLSHAAAGLAMQVKAT